ncbi:IS200/IS605 family element transposase accessory protein TnpB [Candidatus Dependentiae bacterium]|nr:IS200/IS605 family element transposase accessory protein TnpB [Candidatus Dependentiae bacterium]
MKRSISIKLCTTEEQTAALALVQKEFNRACNLIVPLAVKNRCWNHPDLHRIAYSTIRASTSLGSQMVCNSIKAVCNSLKVLKIKASQEVPLITFKPYSSVPFDKRTYSIKDIVLSLYTISGRITVPMIRAPFNDQYLHKGIPKEATLVYKNKSWFFNLVLDLPTPPVPKTSGKVMGIDAGENVLAAMSSGKLFDGKLLRHKCDCALALRSRLQSNGSKSAKQRLKKISGKEARHIKHVNHTISKALIQEALDAGCDTIALEDLKNIRKQIKAGKRMRLRLHRWPWAQLQAFIVYKAQAAGLKVVFVNPAYTSKLCATCGNRGIRNKHRFECKACGILRHSDLNASLNIRRIAASADTATGTVNYPHMGVA